MQSKVVSEILGELAEVHRKLDDHLSEGVGVKRDIAWIKILLGLVISCILSLWFKK